MSLLQTPRGAIQVYEANKGDAHTILYIHGAGGVYLDIPHTLRRMDGYHVVAMDLPGHGKSPGSGRDSIGDYARDIIAVMDTLHITSAIIGGHSMGGAIAQYLALAFPERVSGLILLGTAAQLVVNPQIITRLRDSSDEAIFHDLIKWSWGKQVDESIREMGLKRLKATPRHITANDYAACSVFDVRDQLARLSVPALVLAGKTDKMIPQVYSHELAERIANSTYHTFEGGHMFMLEHSERVADVVRTWLASNFGA